MEPKLQEIVKEIADLTEMKKLKWELVPNQPILTAPLGPFTVRLSSSGTNVALQLLDGPKAIASYAERRNQPNAQLYPIWKSAHRQTLGTDEKLDQALEELKKLKG